jgi:hypothetical protein
MARAESKIIMGYLPVEARHFPALFSLVAPATQAVRLLDPFAGEGVFLEAAAAAWNVTPYANELDGERAAVCLTRFGATQAVRCDVERLIASNNAFGILWANHPTIMTGLLKAVSGLNSHIYAMPGSGCKQAALDSGVCTTSTSPKKPPPFSPNTVAAWTCGRCPGNIKVNTIKSWSLLLRESSRSRARSTNRFLPPGPRRVR